MKAVLPYLLGILIVPAAAAVYATSLVWVPWADEHAGLGGWMQGVFTFAAIIAAYVIGERAARHQRTLEQDRALAEDRRFHDKAVTLATLLKTAVENLGALSAVISLPPGRNIKEIEAATYKIRLDVIAGAMSSFPAERLPQAAMYEFLMLAGLAANALPLINGLGKTRRSGDAIRVAHMVDSVQTLIELVRDGEARLRAEL